MSRPLLPLIALILPLATATPAFAADPPKPDQGKASLDLRLRWEQVDDDLFARQADALTLRLRAGYRTPVRNGFSLTIEGLVNQHLGDDAFNSTGNGNLAYPVVADPDWSGLHQLFVSYAPRAGTQATLGRQRLNYDNQRFIGSVGWRQNEQTFDALDIQHKSAGGWILRYSYLDRVNRVFRGDEALDNNARWQLDAHLLSVGHALGPGTLTGYAHYIENQTLPLNSHRDLGLRYVAKKDRPEGLGWNLALEVARQDDYAHGNSNIDAHYALVEGGLVWRGNGFKLGWEQLSGNGSYAFQTPLATLHAFNGWADRFLTTPVNGLEDRYVGWSRKFGKLNASVTWHDFRSDRGSIHYGREWDASLAYAFSPHWNGLLKFADYQRGDVGADVRKTWVSVEYTY
jgi:hypothetical protein